MVKKRYGKLVRDKLPEIIRSESQIPNVRTMEADEYRNELLYKLIEEAEEVRKCGEYKCDEKEFIIEIADLLEVLYAVFAEFKIDEGAVEKARRQKLEKKGGFKDKIFLESIISS